MLVNGKWSADAIFPPGTVIADAASALIDRLMG